MIRLGLTQRVEIVAGRDERRDCLDQAWTRLLTAHGFFPIPLPNCTEDVETCVKDLALQGVVLTGGNDLGHLPGAATCAPERDRFELRLLEVCSNRELPVLGVCRGLQVLVSAAGGELVRVANHVGRLHGIRSHPQQGIPLSDREQVNSFHEFGVSADALGRDLVPVAFAPDGSVEAAVHNRLPQWGIMWHPERSPHDERDVELLRALFVRRTP
jgi:putative glutamine amidotransferase